MGYTAQFGNGFSATIAAEAPRKTTIVNTNTITSLTPFSGNQYGGFQAPDVVANLRVDQAWGSAQIMGALHEVNATYYLNTPSAGGSILSLASGHPDDKLGWVIGAGFKLNTPWLLNWLGTGAGDYFQTQVNYTQGALRYLFQTTQPSWGFNDSGNSAGFAPVTDAVYGGVISGTGLAAATSLNLTSAWNVNAAYEHFWSPRWRTSLYGGYAKVENGGGTGFGQGCTFSGTTGLVIAGCSGDWNTWWLGSRTQWNVTKDFYMGLDVMYSKLQSATAFNGLAVGSGTLLVPLAISPNLGAIPATDPDNWSFRFRVHRDFYP